jgi:hypothetical protein
VQQPALDLQGSSNLYAGDNILVQLMLIVDNNVYAGTYDD